MISRIRALFGTPRVYALACFYLGLFATLAGNVGTADLRDPWAVLVAALPAVALLFVFEMITRLKPLPSRRRWYHQAMRVAPAVSIMGFCAALSVGHLLELAHSHGQHGTRGLLWAVLPDAMMLLSAVVLKDSPKPRKAAKPAARRVPARKPATKRATAAKTAAVAPSAVHLPVARRTRGHLSLLFGAGAS